MDNPTSASTDQCDHAFLAEQLRALAEYHDLSARMEADSVIVAIDPEGNGEYDIAYRDAQLSYRSVLRQIVAYWG